MSFKTITPPKVEIDPSVKMTKTLAKEIAEKEAPYEVLVVHDAKSNTDIQYEIPDRRSSKSETPQISKDMAEKIKEIISAVEAIPEIM